MSTSCADLSEPLLIVGAGCAGAEVALQARSGGWTGPITLIGEEPHPPYHRPPLSKAYLKGESSEADLALKSPALYEKADIACRWGVRTLEIDRARQTLLCSDGTSYSYGRLVLATGVSPRQLDLKGRAAPPYANLHYVRTLDDVKRIRLQFQAGHRLVMIGAGYIGLEVAAAACAAGLDVTVLEAAPRVLSRVTSQMVSAYYERVHRQHGVRILSSRRVEELEVDTATNRVIRVVSGGEQIHADVVVVGIGVLPRVELAESAGLDVDNGVLVNASMQTNDPHIYAVGDCSRYFNPLYRRLVRLESVPSALEQARTAAAALVGKERKFDSLPWFWSDQYSLRLKMAGLSDGFDQSIVRGDPETNSFSVFYLEKGRILAVDTINRPGEFMQSKKWVAERLVMDPERLANDEIPLKEI